MAAYAALVSLLNTIDQIIDHPRLSITLDKNHIQFLKEKVNFLLDFIESGPRRGREEETEVLERQIASAAYAAEDVIESHAVDQIQAAKGSVSLLDLETVIQDMDYVKEKVVTFNDEIGLIKDLKPKYYDLSSSSTSSVTPLTTTGKSTMFGFDHELYQLMDALTGHQTALQIIPIVGMGGIGKTTLAKNVYQHSLILHHFDIRAWATISLEYNVKYIFSDLLSRERKSTLETEDQQLALELYQTLISRRYLIVLDDMWSIEVWDKLKFFFPDNKNGSCILVTTRLSNMATHFGTLPLPLKLLDKDNSWKLFCEKAFPQHGCCPSELEEFGRKIAEKCGGLPLLIVVVGALLRKSSRTPEYWEDISNDINSILNTGQVEEIESLNILSLSYQHLPAHLKPCFLYMGVFPEDDVIRASRVIKLWIAEGFVKSNKTQSLEEIAQGYLTDLIDRNLLVLKRWNGIMKTCHMHDLLRDLCFKISEKEKFHCVMRASGIRQGLVDNGRIIVFQRGTSSHQTTPRFDNFGSDLIKFKLLRVLNMSDGYCYMDDFLKQVNLRYVCIDRDLYKQNTRDLLSSISLLWNLQTLIIENVGEPLFAPQEIWEMRQLRHVNIFEVWLPDPPLSSNQLADHELVQLRLQTLKTALNLSLSEEVYKRILNVKKLNLIYEDLSVNLSYDFGRLHKLEFLKCWFWKKPDLDDLLQSLTFPSSLQKLILRGCRLRWEDLSMIGSLPHLQVLRLKQNSVTGSEWNPVVGEFLRLKLLEVSCWDLINWNSDYSNFPVLEELVLLEMQNLNEIPLSIGEIPTLGLIDLVGCSESAAISAMKILDEQESLGNDGLQVRIDFLREVELRRFKEKVKDMECFTSTNLQFHKQLKRFVVPLEFLNDPSLRELLTQSEEEGDLTKPCRDYILINLT